MLSARRSRVAWSGPAPSLEYQGLEIPELDHAAEAGEVATRDQLSMGRLVDQRTILRPVQAAMEEVVELGAGYRPALMRTAARPQQGHWPSKGSVTVIQSMAAWLRSEGREDQEHQVRRVPLEAVGPTVQVAELLGKAAADRGPLRVGRRAIAGATNPKTRCISL